MLVTERSQVRFRVACRSADAVHLAGDFNHWCIPGVPMTEREPGCWEVCVTLPPGHQRVGYFAMRWEDDRPGGGGTGSTRQWVDETWLSQYETLNVAPTPRT